MLLTTMELLSLLKHCFILFAMWTVNVLVQRKLLVDWKCTCVTQNSLALCKNVNFVDFFLTSGQLQAYTLNALISCKVFDKLIISTKLCNHNNLIYCPKMYAFGVTIKEKSTKRIQTQRRNLRWTWCSRGG